MTVNRNSSPIGLATYHLVHNDLMQTAINMTILTTLGRYHWTALGPRSFLSLAAVGAILGSLATGSAVMKDSNYSAAGGYAISGAFLTYHAFKTPMLFSQFKRFRMLPIGWLALAMLYGMKSNDQGLVAGLAGGYLAFAIGLI